MKGLMLKDLYGNMRSIRYYLFFLLFFTIMGYFMKNPAYICMLQIIISINLSFSVFNYDEYNKWDVFALALPLSRKTIVKTRYLEGLIMTWGTAVDCCILGCLISFLLKTDYLDAVVSCFACLLVSMFFLSVLFPFIYKMGVERARIILIGLLLVIMAVFLLGIQLTEHVAGFAVWSLEPSAAVVVGVTLTVIFILYFLSYQVSLRIYSKKEF